MKKWYFISPLIIQKLVWIPTRFLLVAFGRIQIRGLEYLDGLNGNAIFACNHSSELDPFMVPVSLSFTSRFSPIFYASREKSFYINSGWRKHIYGGLLFKACGSYPVSVGLHDYAKSLENQIRIVNDGGNLCIYPEGRKTRDGAVQPGKGGVAYLALSTGRPIIPVRIDGLFQFSFADFFAGRRQLAVSFGAPMYASASLQSRAGFVPSVEDFKKYANEVMDKIRDMGSQTVPKAMQVYDNPKYYEIAFSFRDISKEVDFIEQLIAKESRIPVKTFLEIASGNSPHMKELCKRGYDYIGLEISKQMIGYAHQKIKDDSLSAKIVEGDMIKFSLPQKIDCALLFLGSFYIKNDEELRDHLDSVAGSIKSGGLYILDGAVNFFPEDFRKQSWDMVDGDIKVTTTYDPKRVDDVKGIFEAKITLDIDDGGKKKKIEHTEIRKIYSADEFIKKAEQTGKWECVDSFSNFNIAEKPRKGQRNIVVLRRR